ncbi:MAG: hypothetical protein ACOH14_07665 [Rhodoglobus sp.]
MTANPNDFWLLDENGMPETFIDSTAMAQRASETAAELLDAAGDAEAVALLISERVMGLPAIESVKLLFAATLLDTLTSDVLARYKAVLKDAELAMQTHLATHTPDRAQIIGDSSPESEA